MQIEAAYTDLISKVHTMGETDAQSGLNPDIVPDILEGYAHTFVEKDIAEKIRRREVIQKKMADLKSQLDILKNKITDRKNDLRNTPTSSIYKSIIYYLIPAVIYIVCDVFFSKELIVKGWGLGLSSQIETWTLAMGIGLAPFLVKFMIDRFVEPAYLSDSVFLKRLITGFYISLCITVIISFLQVAYLRGIIFKYTKISVEGNAYDSLYAHYPQIMTVSFVTVAFMFVIGGGILMSIGGKEMSNWALRRKLQKQIMELEKTQKLLTNDIAEYSGLIAQSEFMNLDAERINREKEHMVKELSYEYTSTYKSRLTSVKKERRQKEILENGAHKNFHEYTREILDRASRNGEIQLQKKNYGQ